MGTEISLDIGGMSISWAKNHRGPDHGFLFQPADRKRIRAEPENEKDGDEPRAAHMEMGFSRPLRTVLPRLELLGYTIAAAQDEYGEMAAICGEMDTETPKDFMSFSEFLAFLKTVTIADLDNTFISLDEDKIQGRFTDEKVKAKIPYYSPYDRDAYSERSYFAYLVRFLHPYVLLRLIAEHPANLELSLDWKYGPLVSNGWAEENEFGAGARRAQTYLIATEGSSDTHILSRAFQILCPEIADFFRFIDVRERHPFSGAGSLMKFAEGLAKIDVQNRTIFLLDNDAEGVSAFVKIREMNLPINMKPLTLPSLDAFSNFPTIGPDGQRLSDINGKAAAIECYLDLRATGLPLPLVRWTNFKETAGVYQGALEQKERYCATFFDQIGRVTTYDTSKLQIALTSIVQCCTAMATETLKENSESLVSRANSLD
jgi:hypothetical protein